VGALRAWLHAAEIIQGPIFRSIKKGGRLTEERLTDRSVADIIKKRSAAAGLEAKALSGHSLRSGFVTEALTNGADVFRVMDVTRHRQVNTLKIYDRRAKAFLDHAGAAFL
jgi:site-specific recombinase XerD